MKNNVKTLENQLNSFSSEDRSKALQQLLSLADQNVIPIPLQHEVANMHSHTFFSYNGYGFSPSALAWLAKKEGYGLFGIVDFDVLDGVDEFLSACDAACVRGTAGMETRVFIPEFATREINSPGEPGIFYHMGIGFTSSRVPESETKAAEILSDMRSRAYRRNRGVIERVNNVLTPVILKYDNDVLPLTPSGNATERHICAAYVQKARELTTNPTQYWTDKLHTPYEDVASIIDNGPAIQNLVRAKLMKRGGVGYVQPGPATFPSLEEVNEVITACGALPCATWLDGTSSGEQAEEELLSLLIDKGIVALNIIPDRNWNIPDPQVKARKLKELYKVVDLAKKLNLPINVGTEMNAFGKKQIDDFDSPELTPLRDDFINGAYFMFGHTVLQRCAGMGYQSQWAKQFLPSRQERNIFYTRVGRITAPGKAVLEGLKSLISSNQTPSMVVEKITNM